MVAWARIRSGPWPHRTAVLLSASRPVSRFHGIAIRINVDTTGERVRNNRECLHKLTCSTLLAGVEESSSWTFSPRVGWALKNITSAHGSPKSQVPIQTCTTVIQISPSALALRLRAPGLPFDPRRVIQENSGRQASCCRNRRTATKIFSPVLQPPPQLQRLRPRIPHLEGLR